MTWNASWSLSRAPLEGTNRARRPIEGSLPPIIIGEEW
jgi:hypothetical protein